MMLQPFLQPAVVSLGFGALLALVVASIPGSTIDTPAQSEQARDKPAPTKIEPTGPNIDALIAEILDRPLFTASRQPAEAAPPAEAVEVEKPLPQITGRLSGVMISSEAREAIFEQQGRKPVAVKVGQELDGWTILSIDLDSVVLKSTAGEQVLKPMNAKARGAQLQAANRKPVPPPKNAPAQPKKQQAARPNVRNGR